MFCPAEKPEKIHRITLESRIFTELKMVEVFGAFGSIPSPQEQQKLLTKCMDNDVKNYPKNAKKYPQGTVEFDLGFVSHPRFGSTRVKARFPRLLPKFERSPVPSKHLDALSSKLMVWVRSHFVVGGHQEVYFKEIALAVTLFTAYVYTQPDLYSEEMFLALKIVFWLWYNDDKLEEAIEANIPFKTLPKCTDQLSGILKGDAGNFKDIPNWPFFKAQFSSLLDLHREMSKSSSIVPNYEKRVERMGHYLKGYFEAQRWYSVDRVDGRYSEQSFRHWRRVVAYFDGIAEVIALIEGVTLPKEIYKSLTLKRILEITNSFGGFVNDLVGMKKEFENGQTDNLVIFKVLSKNILLEKAVEEVCQHLEEELEDYFLLKEVILKEFDQEDNLVRYLDILESLIDGHNRIYPESTRHKSAGSVVLYP